MPADTRTYADRLPMQSSIAIDLGGEGEPVLLAVERGWLYIHGSPEKIMEFGRQIETAGAELANRPKAKHDIRVVPGIPDGTFYLAAGPNPEQIVKMADLPESAHPRMEVVPGWTAEEILRQEG